MITFATAAWSRNTLKAPNCLTAVGVNKHQFDSLCSATGSKEARCLRLGLLLGLLQEKGGEDDRDNATGRNGHGVEEIVELLVVADRELHVARGDA